MAKGWNTSPARVYQAFDEQNRSVWIEVNFNLSTLAIINPGALIHRDPECALDTLVLGLDAVRNRTEFPIPEGDTTMSRGQLNGAGFSTVQDVTDAGITFRNSTV